MILFPSSYWKHERIFLSQLLWKPAGTPRPEIHQSVWQGPFMMGLPRVFILGLCTLSLQQLIYYSLDLLILGLVLMEPSGLMCCDLCICYKHKNYNWVPRKAVRENKKCIDSVMSGKISLNKLTGTNLLRKVRNSISHRGNEQRPWGRKPEGMSDKKE
jgi:hypothetical protein